MTLLWASLGIQLCINLQSCGAETHLCAPLLQHDANGTSSGPTHVVIGNAGYKLSWAANPRPPPYWATVAIDHGFLRCDVNATVLYCEVTAQSPLSHYSVIVVTLAAASAAAAAAR
jgi:hypothetical protein